jgi:hypothetical protein
MSKEHKTVLVDPTGQHPEYHVALHINDAIEACRMYMQAQALRDNIEAVYDDIFDSWDYWHPGDMQKF